MRRAPVPTDVPTLPDEGLLFRLLRQLDAAPEASQRLTAQALGVSLGRLNGLLRAATEAGLVAVATRPGPDKRQRFAYALTTRGAVEMTRLTDRFLAGKLAEYDALHAELTGKTSGLLSPKTRTTEMAMTQAPIPELYVSYDSAQKLKHEAATLPSLGPVAAADLRSGAADERRLQPAEGLPVAKPTTTAWSTNMRLADGALWPMPITLDVSESFAETVEPGQDIALRDAEGVILAIMSVTDKWTPDKAHEAEKVFGADDIAHPGGGLSAPHRGQGLSGRPDHRHPAADALRFPRPPRHAERAARAVPQARLAPGRGVPDPQPAAPRASGTDLPRRQAKRRRTC